MNEGSFLGLNIGFIVQTTLIVAATVVAALWGNRFLRKKATIDYILNLQRDQRLRAAKAHLLKTHAEELVRHASRGDGEDPLRDDLFYLLNCYEYFAVGIHEKCFHDKLARRLNRSLMITIWNRYRPLIEELRTDKGLPDLYCELETLVKRWQR